jgi:fucose permease
VTYPAPAADPLIASSPHADADAVSARGLLPTTLRQGTVLLGTMLLSLYVGLEIGVGNWGFTYLSEGRAMPALIAGYAMSGYWLGLTLGRFVLGSLTARLGLQRSGLMYVSLIGMTASTGLIWAVGHGGVASVLFAVLGFFLGPVFPTTMSLAPDLTSARFAPTAIGVMNAGSTIGGAALPWLAGAVTESVGVWTLLPFALVLAAAQLGVWWWLAARLRQARQKPEPATALAAESRA